MKYSSIDKLNYTIKINFENVIYSKLEKWYLVMHIVFYLMKMIILKYC